MSRRYGRNQKRRAREEIAQREQAIASLLTGMAQDRALLQRQRMDIAERDDQLKFVAKVLGTNFIGLRPALYEFREKHQSDYFRHQVNGGDVLMHTMRTYVTSSPDRPDYMVHFRVELAGKSIGYAVSECALWDAPLDYLVRRISDEMALQLMDELRNKFGRSRR